MANLTGNELGKGGTSQQNLNAPGNLPVQTQQTKTTPAGTAPAAAGTGTTSAQSALMLSVQGWADPLFEQYLGRPASTSELTWLSQGWTADRLKQYLRTQASWIPGMNMGQYEDLHNASRNEFLKYLGHEPSDQDIRDLAARGIRDEFAINNYLKNRADVVALHPGAPIDLTDDEFGHWKEQTNAHYMQNLQREASDEEARNAYLSRNTAAPAKGVDISPEFRASDATGGLEAKNIVSPTARAF